MALKRTEDNWKKNRYYSARNTNILRCWITLTANLAPKRLPVAQGGEMPLFMDRHDIRGSTAEDVAQAHQSNLEVQTRYFCKAITYWYE